MDIVDTQVHSNLLSVDTTIGIMDALGIQSLVIDEWLPSNDGLTGPNYKLPGGIARPIAPNAEAAALLHPDRFCYLMRINPLDPMLDAWLETLSVSPGFRAIRAGIGPTTSVAGDAFSNGAFDRMFEICKRLGLPAFITAPSSISQLGLYATKFPDVQFVIDHCGANFGGPPGQRSMAEALNLAALPNVSLKWAHAPYFFSLEPYPFSDLEPVFQRAIDAFGVERIMWASDYTVSGARANWAESLFSIRNSSLLSASDKEWVLGRTARKTLNWPAPPVLSTAAISPYPL